MMTERIQKLRDEVYCPIQSDDERHSELYVNTDAKYDNGTSNSVRSRLVVLGHTIT